MPLIKSYDPLQSGYKYRVDPGLKRRADFNPDLSPAMCLRLGVFGGAYFRQYPKLKREFPDFEYVRSETEVADNNFYGVNASMSRHEWVIRGWMHLDDPRGWFQWWCRYELGRRHEDDDRQIGRWLVFKARKLREIGDNTDQSKHVRTRQGLLHWGIKSPGMGIY